MTTTHYMPLPTAAFFPTHSSEHNTYYVVPALNIQHNLNQQAHNTTNNIEWNQTLTPSYHLQCWTSHATGHNLHSWRWTYRCPKHVELFMIINHNCCIKLEAIQILYLNFSLMAITIYIQCELLFINKKLRKIWRQLRNNKIFSDTFNRRKCLYLSILWWNKVTIKSVRYV